MNRRTFFAQAALGVFVGVARSLAGEGLKMENPPRDASLPLEPWKLGGEDVLSRWQAAARRPLVEGDVAELRMLAEAVRCGRRVSFRYLGGSDFGGGREISPAMLYTADGFESVYLSGYCHRRGAERTFVVARMQAIEVRAA